jgi:hypothetical protein
VLISWAAIQQPPTTHARTHTRTQGTYEVNVLVAGRGATGISAIKAPSRAAQAAKQHAQA